ncbi:Protein of unknown function [Algoriella xinjiangensis]|uniref:YetF C-terminal domain-containing protein n=1 Tax=Algoriella xinjiangensis TaxID=684065 RepID=A0A1I4Z6T3_9FLAO|nr:YetF domain-containing protein [Algoriella xinjiangensis]SFN45887.1 Protein of unknown function [Algoriella xinjiangensis]VDH16498.1 Protein of uncharacterised function (DUF421) [Algoriella xinjiangensis]
MEGYLDIIIRCISVYFFMLIALRIFGKQDLSQLNTADVILILLISNAVQNAMVGTDSSLIGGLVAALILFLINFVVKKWLMKSKFFGNLIEQKPEILISNGKADFKTLSKLDINSEELSEAMREHGVEHIKDVKLAMMEIDGNISIITGTDDNMKQTHYKRKHNHKNLQGAN